MLEAFDVVVVDDPDDPAMPRLARSLDGQAPWWRADPGADRWPGSAPWLLLLRESDRVAPGGVAALRAAAGAVVRAREAQTGVAVDALWIDLVLSAGSPPRASRLLLRRGASRFLRSVAAPDPPRSATAVATIELDAATLAPLGLAARPTALVAVPTPVVEPLDLAVVALTGGGDAAGSMAGAAVGGAPWLAFGAAGWLDALGRQELQDKTTVLVGGGASAVFLCRSDERRARWQRFEPALGDALDVVVVVCRREDLRAALAEDVASIGDVAAAVVRTASAAGSVSFHDVGTGTAARLAPGPVPAVIALTVPAARADAGGAGVTGADVNRPGPDAAGRAPAAGWAPRAVTALELVWDGATRRLLLASELAPLDPAAFPSRVVIGGVEVVPFPGSAPLVAQPGAGVVGFCPTAGLNDCSSLYRRAELGRAELGRRIGIRLDGYDVPGADSGLFVHRAPSPIEDRGPGTVAVEPTTVLVGMPPVRSGMAGRGDGGPTTVVLRHPDALGAVAERQDLGEIGVFAGLGPGLAVMADPQRCTVDGPLGTVGYGRVRPRPGDGAGPVAGRRRARWYGLAPDTLAVPLQAWETAQGPRYTAGGPPRTARGPVDPTARFVHTLGWAVRAGTPRTAAVHEWYHPHQRRWRYGSDAEEGVSGGWRHTRVICGLEPVPTVAHVALYRTVRPGGETVLHAVAEHRSAAQPLAGWLRIMEEAAAWPDLDTALDLNTALDLDTARPQPFPGAWPVFLVHGEGIEPTRTVSPAVWRSRGAAVRTVVGYIDPPAGLDELAWLVAQHPPAAPAAGRLADARQRWPYAREDAWRLGLRAAGAGARTARLAAAKAEAAASAAAARRKGRS